MIVTYRDVDITASVTVTRCTLEQREDGRLPTLTVDFDDTARTWDRWGSRVGDKISVLEDGAPKSGDLYIMSCEPRQGTWRVRATPLATPDFPRSQAWDGASATTMLSQIAGQLGLALACHGLYDAPYEWVRQSGTDMAMAQMLATLSGASVDVYDGTMHVWGHDWAISRGVAGTIALTGESDARIVRRTRYGSCTIEQTAIDDPARAALSWSYVADATLPATRASVPAQVAFEDTEPMRAAAKAALAQTNAQLDCGNVSTDALSPYTPGVAVRVESDADPTFGGVALVTRVRNDLLNKRSKTWWRRV